MPPAAIARGGSALDPSASTSPIGIGALEGARLWLSYQRYALLMVGLPAGLTAALGWGWPGAWWAWGPAVLLTLYLGGHARTIAQRWPYKRLTTLRFARRVAAGRFDPQDLRSLCGDPCFRVVAREILSRAGIRGAARRALLRRLSAEQADRGRQLILVNRADGVVFQVDGAGVRRRLLAAGPSSHHPPMEGNSNGR